MAPTSKDRTLRRFRDTEVRKLFCESLEKRLYGALEEATDEQLVKVQDKIKQYERGEWKPTSGVQDMKHIDIERELGIIVWHIFMQRGEGNMLEGRARTLNTLPEHQEWIDGYEYVVKTNPKSPLRGVHHSQVLEYAKHYYTENIVGLCLDALWYDQGLPTIQLGHKLASSLLLTRTPEDVLDSIELPFHAFHINVPNGLLDFEDGEIRYIVVGRHVKPSVEDRSKPVAGYAFIARAENGGSFSVGGTLGGLLQSDFSEFDEGYIDGATSLKPLPLEHGDIKKLPLVAQLIAGVCLYMTGDPKNFPVKQIGKGHKAWEANRREPGPPLVRTFQLTRPVEHNFKQLVQDYCAGRGTKMSVQCVVTGHWRNQACGPRLSERKRIFVEPHWRGSRDAPIALRPHNLE